MLFNDFILRFDMPKHILHDPGKDFQNKLFHKLTKLCRVKKPRTTSYYPQTNATIEHEFCDLKCVENLNRKKEDSLEGPHQEVDF